MSPGGIEGLNWCANHAAHAGSRIPVTALEALRQA